MSNTDRQSPERPLLLLSARRHPSSIKVDRDNGQHPIETLFGEVSRFGPYPMGVVPVPSRIAGTAFFPGGAGLWGAQGGEPLPGFPLGGIMVLGHDFDSLRSFNRSYAAGTEVERLGDGGYRMGATWRNLLTVLKGAGIERDDCFFTNAYMGLRSGDQSTGRFPGATDPDFVARCQVFLRRQIALQQPRLILTLGAWVPRFVAPLAPALGKWIDTRSLSDVDRVGPVVTDVRFDADTDSTVVVALTHPSLRNSNVRRRRYRGCHGIEAEVAILAEAMASVGMGYAQRSVI